MYYYVYILKSINYPDQLYVGRTKNLKQRLGEHNGGESLHTAKYRPWHVEMYFAFSKAATAVAFEQYLKSGSGREFTKRHFFASSLNVCSVYFEGVVSHD